MLAKYISKPLMSWVQFVSGTKSSYCPVQRKEERVYHTLIISYKSILFHMYTRFSNTTSNCLSAYVFVISKNNQLNEISNHLKLAYTFHLQFLQYIL